MHALSIPAAGRRVGACAVALIAFALLLHAPNALADFGVDPSTFAVSSSTTQAGAATDLTTSFALNHQGDGNVDGNLKDLRVDLPAGVIGDPGATPRCKTSEFMSLTSCPMSSQVGTMDVVFNIDGMLQDFGASAVYNMVPTRGETAELAAVMFSPIVSIVIHVRSDGDYGLTATLHNAADPFAIESTTMTLWGVPADAAHDGDRGTCLQTSWDPTDKCPSPAPRRAFLRNGAACGPQQASVSVDSWQNPEREVRASADMAPVTGCDKLPPVEPNVSIQPVDRSAGSPSGYDVDLDVPQVDNPDAVATPPLKMVSIQLPAGTAISPSSADGLGACSDEQLHQHDTSPVACPDSSKIGTVSITTPFLDQPLEGAMYLGQPQPNDQFRLFMVAEGSGVSVRLKGSAVPDPNTGRLTVTFDGLPPIAFSHLHVHMKGGPRAVLANPTSCGTATSTTTVTPVGGGAAASSADSFSVAGDCAAPAFAPTLSAGTTNPVAGAESPFVLQVSRADGQEDLKSLAVDLPTGLIGKVAGLPLCPTAQAASGTCGDVSKVGSVAATVGTGSNPITLPGSVYMTEPYGGGQFGLDFVVPAKIGPFDFGNVNVRAGVQVDPFSGALRVQTDPLPSIIAGIPLHYRAVTVDLDRAGFMRNPTSCLEKQITASLTSALGAVHTAAARFQVAGCAALPLAPKIRATFNDAKQKHRRGKPGFSFKMTQAPGQSNLQAVAVMLPKQVGVSLGLPEPCTPDQFEAHSCPDATRIGDSSVTTPLLDGRLQGGVYLVANGKAGGLPRLGVQLDGQVPISLLSTVSVGHGHLTTTFLAPDLPISTFKLTLRSDTALTNAKDLCAHKPTARVTILGASGARYRKTISVPAQGCPYGHHRAAKSARAGRAASKR